jgi:hypothetical protein
MNTFHYNADCKQPDPEIWGGGAVGGPLVLASNLNESFSRIYNNEITTPNSATGVISIYGAFIVKASWVGIATHTISGYIDERRSYSYSGDAEITISGSAVEKFISSDDITAGSLESDISSIEKVTYDYNLDSSVGFSTEDDGLISASITEIFDYGNILDLVTEGQEDYGSTEILSETSSAIGNIIINGSASYVSVTDDINTILLVLSGTLVEQVSWNTPESTATIGITGSAFYSFIGNPPEDEINLIPSGQGIEKKTIHYNESSVTAFEPDPYGIISDPITQTLDYGLISSPVTQGQEDQGLLIFTESNTPFGTASFSGSAFVRPPADIKMYDTGADYAVSYNPPENTAYLFKVGDVLESAVFDYNTESIVPFEIEDTGSVSIASTQTDDYGFTSDLITTFIDYNTIAFPSADQGIPFGLFTVSGSAEVEYTDKNFYSDTPGAEVKVVYSPAEGDGSLFGVGGISEIVVFSYTEDSIREFVVEDSQSISDSPTIVDNYGLITDTPTTFEDYEVIDESLEGSTPFGLFTVSGSAEVEYTDKNFYSDTPGAEVKVVYSPDNTEGTLFGFGQKLESVAYDYNEDSILVVGTPNYGTIGVAATITEDYGVVTDTHTQSEDIGSILGFSAGEDVYPFGIISISGFGLEKLDAQTPEDTVNIVITGNGLESFTPQTEIGSGILSISGESDVPLRILSEVGTGSLFSFGEKLESVTYDYTLDSTVGFVTESSGSVSDPITLSLDYGYVYDIVSQGQEDYSTVILGEDTGAFGTISIVGSADLRENKIYDVPLVKVYKFLEDYVQTGLNTSSFVGVAFSDRGPGVGAYSGFNIDRHINFVGAGGPRWAELLPLDLERYASITISAIRGNSGNGGEDPELNENLLLQYKTATDPTWITVGTIVSENDPDFQTLNDVTLSLPEGARTNTTTLRFFQQNSSGPQYDNYAITGYVLSPLEYTPRLFTYSGGCIERTVAVPPTTQAFISLSESSEFAPVVYNEVGGGSLFSIGEVEDSVTYDYSESSILPFEIDDAGSLGPLTPTILTDTILPDELLESEFNGVLTNTLLSDSGTGSGSTGGFNVGRHIRFNGTLAPRIVEFSLPRDVESELTFEVIRGSDFNGGEDPDQTSENLNLDYSLNGGSSWTRIDTVVAYNDTSFNSLKSVSIAVPSEARSSGTLYRLIQTNHNGNNWDNYGVTNIGYDYATYPGEDYGFVSETLDAGETDYGNVSDPSVDIPPFGTLTISGTAGLVYIDAKFYDDVNVESKVRVAYSPDDTTGTLFTIDGGSESVVYDYNIDSIREFAVEDSGSITSGVTSTEDYGLITEIPTSFGDSGLTEETIEGTTPFGLFTISGSANVEYRNVNIYAEANVRRTFSPDDTTGTLFGFGEKLESFTFDYNEESIFFAGVPDSGSIGDIVSTIEDYGFVYEIHAQTEDYQSLIDPATSTDVYPFGTFSVLGSAEIDATFDEVFTGLFDIYGSALTDYTPEYTGVGTLNISGTSIVKFTSSEVSTDDIVVSGTKSERRTKSYNESSILTLGEQVLSYGSLSTTTELSADYGSVAEIATENSEELGSVTSGITSDIYPFGTITISGDLDAPDIDLTPKYTGSGLITISGSALESETEDFGSGRRRGGNIRFCGDAIYSETDAYVGFGTIFLDAEGISVPALLSRTRAYVGIETILISDSAVERDAESYVGLGTATFSGTALEAYSAQTPEGTQLFTFYGELRHPDIDLTPHYGIEKNIGVGTTGIQLSGTAVESESEAYAGVGTISVVNGLSPEEFYPWLPTGIGRSWSFTKGNYAGGGSITLSTGVPTRTYSPIYPRNALIGDPGSGNGLIRINDDKEITFYRATLPIFAEGTIYIVGVGSEGQFDVGGEESFTPTTYIASGQVTISGIASTREVDVFQDFETSGVITISSETAQIIEKTTFSEVGIGTIFVSDTIVFRETNAYDGTGTILAISGGAEAYSAQTPEDTATLQISGSAQESFVAQTPEDTVLYTFSGQCEEDFTPSPDGSGTIFISGASVERGTGSHVGSGTFRFVKHTCDQTYDTCDSDDIYSDEIGSARESFTANTPEDTVLFNIDGSATTAETALYTKVATGLFTLSGTFQDIKLTNSESGIGTIFLADASSSSERDVYVGSGSLFAISSSDSLYSANTPENTVILQISGSAITSVESDFFAVGVGLFNFNGSAVTKGISSYPVSGSGIITISGELVHPDIVFLPAPKGSGTINILGSSSDSLTKLFDTTGVLFTFSGGFESFSKSTYIGVGTIYFQDTPASTINNPYQIPRSYVCII